MKIIAPQPTCADRYPVRLLAPVAFDGRLIQAGDLVELSDTQAVELIYHERGVAATESEVAAGKLFVVRARAVMEWPDGALSARKRRRWRPQCVASKRVPRQGWARLDMGAGLVEQIRGYVER